VATCLRQWRALPLRSPTRRWRAWPLAEIEPFHSTPVCRLLISVSAFNFRVDFRIGRKKGVRCHHHQIAKFDVQPCSNFAEPPCSAASFEVNSEPHTGARPLARLCVGLIRAIMLDSNLTLSYLNGFGESARFLGTSNNSIGNDVWSRNRAGSSASLPNPIYYLECR
jgi:hypothetical protein